MVYGDDPAGDSGDSGQRVQIGGDDECEHESLQRVGEDGGYNIYFKCTDCEAGIVKFSETNSARNEDGTGGLADEDLPQDPPTGNERSHPLIGGLSPDDSARNGGRRSEEGVLDRIESSLRDLFGNDREK
jgi:hypothetical protein